MERMPSLASWRPAVLLTFFDFGNLSPCSCAVCTTCLSPTHSAQQRNQFFVDMVTLFQVCLLHGIQLSSAFCLPLLLCRCCLCPVFYAPLLTEYYLVQCFSGAHSSKVPQPRRNPHTISNATQEL